MSKERFAKWMRDQRAALRPVPSQEAIAEIIGVSQETVSKWERHGVGELSPRTIRRIAACYKAPAVEVAALLDYPTQPPTEQPACPPSEPVAILDAVIRLEERLRDLLAESDRERPARSAP